LTNPITGAGIASAVLSGRLAGRAAAAHLEGDTTAAASYGEELLALFGPSLTRALHHRRALEKAWHEHGAPSRATLRRAWIAYPEYWAGRELADVEAMA
jgi:flavin-dependent dehydrogenase